MKIIFILLISILVFTTPLLSAPVDVTPQPPITDPVLPTEKGPIFQVPSDKDAPSPGAAELKVVHHQDLNKKILISLIVASTLLAGILLLLSCFWIYRLKTRKKSDEKSHQKAEPAKGLSWGPIMAKFPSLRSVGRKGLVAVIEYQSLVAATNNFQEQTALGEGRLGCVYKAQFNNDIQAAVKRFRGGEQDAEKEFENEVDLLSKFQHQNIILLLGYCIHANAQFLVYEMMQNGSLEFQLHGPTRGSALSWHLRMKIALDVARGLEYLHERCNPPVIHRDLKSSNVLLDSNFNAKLSDFGLAIAGWNLNKSNVKLSGTLGYVAPEYLLDGKLTDKSDVYAFGIILLELLMGKRPVEKLAGAQCQSIVTWAMPQLTDRSKLPTIVDPVIRNGMDLKHLYQVAAVAVLCVQPEPSYRPLITDVLHSFIPLVPIELGGSLRVVDSAVYINA
ncbi:putative receptor-like protein kinase At1g80640 isoform X2 [Nicotiana tabacum]|uniref:Receptor-like protein kinase At1g80640 isoform X2 n=1 Tax=Nicotiana tabacum TaxID=4097 RepID=A0A1S3XD63_TOBAC|nr:PREDICTED: probable receptor-like protein kinase At1g80640 isoform X2 [Nicotiana tabacum]